MADAFLTDEELVRLTGYKRASLQVKHLKAQRIPFFTNRAGHPRVARAAVEGVKSQARQQPAQWSPSWAGAPART